MFSPIRPTSALRASSTVDGPSGSAASAAASAGFFFSTDSTSPAANFKNSPFLATKSVSQLISTIAFLHSIIGASVLSRSSLTMLAVISAIPDRPRSFPKFKKKGLPPLFSCAHRRSFRFRAGLFDLDELVRGRTDDLLHDLVTALQDGVGDTARIQTDRAAGIIVARNDVGNPVRGMVGIDYPDNRNSELLRFGDRALLVTDVDYEKSVGPAVQLLDASEAALQLGELALEVQPFFFRQLVEAAVLDHRFHILQPLDRLAHGLEVGEHPAEPSMIDVRGGAALGFLADNLARLAFGSDEQHAALVGGELAHEFHRLLVHHHGLFQVDDVDLVAVAEDERRHLRIPVAGLVAEMHARFEHLAHRGRHGDTPVRVDSQPPGPITRDFGHPNGEAAKI